MNGNQLKLQGIEQVTYNNQDFVQMMRNYALSHAQKNGSVTADDMRELAMEKGIEPLHANAWGAVFNTKDLRPVGYTQSRTPSCHSRVIRVWAAA